MRVRIVGVVGRVGEQRLAQARGGRRGRAGARSRPSRPRSTRGRRGRRRGPPRRSCRARSACGSRADRPPRRRASCSAPAPGGRAARSPAPGSRAGDAGPGRCAPRPPRRRAVALVVGDLRHRRRRVVGRRHRQQPVDLLDRAPHRDDRRGPAVGDALLEGADVLLDHRRVAPRSARAASRGAPACRTAGTAPSRPATPAGPDMWSTASWYCFWSSAASCVLADEDHQVAGDDLLRLEPVGRDLLRLGQRRTVAPPRRRRVRPGRGRASGRCTARRRGPWPTSGRARGGPPRTGRRGR